MSDVQNFCKNLLKLCKIKINKVSINFEKEKQKNSNYTRQKDMCFFWMQRYSIHVCLKKEMNGYLFVINLKHYLSQDSYKLIDGFYILKIDYKIRYLRHTALSYLILSQLHIFCLKQNKDRL